MNYCQECSKLTVGKCLECSKVRWTFQGLFDEKNSLSKREIFAALAMQGICASRRGTMYSTISDATQAVKAADALIAELNKEPES